MTMFVKQELCRGCGVCEDACPNGAIQLIEGKAVIDQAKCNDCQECARVCPTGALQYVSALVPLSARQQEPIVIPSSQKVLDRPAARTGLGLAALSLVGRYVLPRLVNALENYFERRQPTVTARSAPVTGQTIQAGYYRRRLRRGRYIRF